MGSGYVRSSHMKKEVGPKDGKGGGKGQEPHTGFLKTGEKNAHVKSQRPDEKHKGYNKGIVRGNDFEQEIKETFKGGGYANIKGKTMPHKNSPVPADGGDCHDHGEPKGKAEHLPDFKGFKPGANTTFRPPATSNAHGFGHSGSQRMGVLRMSGHSKAHRVGSRGK